MNPDDIPALRPYTLVDSRICVQCGAKAGRCDHLEVDEIVVWMTRGHDKQSYWKWSPQRKSRAVELSMHGYTRGEIAEIMNTTADAVAGVLYREKEEMR